MRIALSERTPLRQAKVMGMSTIDWRHRKQGFSVNLETTLRVIMTIQVAGSRRTGVATRTDDESLRTDHFFPVSNFPFFFANSPHLTLLQR